MPYHIGNPIFEDSFIPYAFVNFVDSDDYNSAQRKECVAEFQGTIPAETSIPTVQLWVHHSRRCDHAQPQHVSRWVLHSMQHRNSNPRIPMTQAPSKTFHQVSRPPTTLVSIFGTLCLVPA